RRTRRFSITPKIRNATTINRPYQPTTARRRDLSIDDVALPAARADESMAQALADARHVDVEHVGQRVFGLVVEVLEDHRARDQLPAVHREVLDQRVFLGGERDRRAVFL